MPELDDLLSELDERLAVPAAVAEPSPSRPLGNLLNELDARLAHDDLLPEVPDRLDTPQMMATTAGYEPMPPEYGAVPVDRPMPEAMGPRPGLVGRGLQNFANALILEKVEQARPTTGVVQSVSFVHSLGTEMKRQGIPGGEEWDSLSFAEKAAYAPRLWWSLVKSYFGKEGKTQRQIAEMALREARGDVTFDVPEALTAAEKITDFGTGLGAVVLELALGMRLIPGGVPKGLKVPLAFELQHTLNGGTPGKGLLLGGTLQAIGGIPAASLLGKGAKLGGEMGAFGGLTYVESEDPEEALLAMLIPPTFAGYRLLRHHYRGKFLASKTLDELTGTTRQVREAAQAMAENPELQQFIFSTKITAEQLASLRAKHAPLYDTHGPSRAIVDMIDARSAKSQPSRKDVEGVEGLEESSATQRADFAKPVTKEIRRAPEVREDQARVEEVEPLGPRGEADRGGDVQQAAEARPEAGRPVVPQEAVRGPVPEVAPPVAKEPWEMTLREFAAGVAQKSKRTIAELGGAGAVLHPQHGAAGAEFIQKATARTAIMSHRVHVESALRANKPVPPEVLADYPDLKPEKTMRKAEKPPAEIPPEPPPTPATEAFAAEETQIRTDFPIREGPAEGAVARRSVKALPPPELVQLAKGLMGQYPKIKKLRRYLGRLKTKEGDVASAEIALDPRAAKDPIVLAKTLAHEIGHLVDFLPEGTMKRGNIAGRVAVLKKHMKRYAEGEAIDAKAIRAELIPLSEWWTPYDKAVSSPKYIKYRESSRELYAQALSVLLNTPGETQARAPQFYRGFMEYLDRKPKVLDTYLELQDILAGTPADVAEARRKNVYEQFARGTEKIRKVQAERRESHLSLGSGIRDYLHAKILDRTGPAKKAALGRKHVGLEYDDSVAAMYMLDELFMVDNQGHIYINRVREEVETPLTEAGITQDEIGEYLKMRRIVHGDRNELGNPLGYTPESSAEQLADLQSRLGPEKWALLEDRMQHWHREIVFPLGESAVPADVYSSDTFENVIRLNRDNYATFAVIKYLEDYVPHQIFQQVGTFEEIANPWHATNMKMLTLGRIIEVNKRKAVLRDAMLKRFPDEITEVEIPHQQREPRKPAPPGQEYLYILENGKKKAYAVPYAMARTFRSHDVGSLAPIVRVLSSATYDLFHPIFVTYSPGFLVANPFRDLWRTWGNLGAVGSRLNKRLRAELEAQGLTPAQAKGAADRQRITIGQVLWAFLKSIPEARLRAHGIDGERVKEMFANKALAIPYTQIAAERGELLPGYRGEGEKPTWDERLRSKQSLALRGLGRVLSSLRIAAETQETATKMAAWRLLKQRGVEDREAAYYVRKYAGTPDYKQQAHWTVGLNAVWMYAKVRWNGLQADMDLARDPSTKAAWWWRRMVRAIMPATLTRLAVYGALGVALKKMYDNISSYYLDNYDVIPLGTFADDDDKEKTVFLTIPKDDVSRAMGSVWGRLIDAVIETKGGTSRSGTTEAAFNDLLRDLKGELIPNWTPILDIPATWAQYAMGRNPHDDFFGKRIVPEREWEAGGWDRTRKMLSWTVSKFGTIGTVAHHVTGPLLGEAFEEGDETTIETKVRSAPGFSRLVRVSDAGIAEQQYAQIEQDEQDQAKFQLSLGDAVRQAGREQSKLLRLGPERLGKEDLVRRWVLNQWRGRAYIPITKAIRDADEAGETEVAERLRSSLESETRAYLELPRRPEAERAYIGSLAYNLTAKSATEETIKGVKRDAGKVWPQATVKQVEDALVAYISQRSDTKKPFVAAILDIRPRKALLKGDFKLSKRAPGLTAYGARLARLRQRWPELQ